MTPEIEQAWAVLEAALPKRTQDWDCNYEVPRRSPEAFRGTAKAAALAFEGTLPLIRENGVFERIEVGRFRSGEISVLVRDAASGARAFIAMGWDELVAYFEGRRRPIQDHPWDRSRIPHVVRPALMGVPNYIEPGAAFFVGAVEAFGGKTVFSCEGHPQNFYIDIVDNPEIRARLAGLDGVIFGVVDILLSGSVLRMSLAQEPKTWDERDDALRGLAERFMACLDVDADTVLARLSSPPVSDT